MPNDVFTVEDLARAFRLKPCQTENGMEYVGQNPWGQSATDHSFKLYASGAAMDLNNGIQYTPWELAARIGMKPEQYEPCRRSLKEQAGERTDWNGSQFQPPQPPPGNKSRRRVYRKRKNTNSYVSVPLEESPAMLALLRFIRRAREFKGGASDLFFLLRSDIERIAKTSSYCAFAQDKINRPKCPNWLSVALSKHQEALEERGVYFYRSRDREFRWLTIKYSQQLDMYPNEEL